MVRTHNMSVGVNANLIAGYDINKALTSSWL